ncbi:MAG: cytochrome c oxidase subunit II [Thermoleophilia bacterium]|nr:cytochrome c oxidase subunit II [Thermoleophilia bacterium]
MKGQWGKLLGYVLGTAIVSAALVFVPPLLGSGTGWLPDLISSEGSSIDTLFWGLVWLSIAIFAIVCGVVVYSMVHFRAKPGDMSDGAHIHGDARMELVWIIVPSIIVLVVGVLSYMVLQDNEIGLYDPAKAQDKGAATMQVDVRGFSFGWAFRYADLEDKPLMADENAEPSSELVLPVDQVVKFTVMSCSGKEHLGRIRTETLRELAADGEEDEYAKVDPGLCEQHWDATTKEDQAKAVADAEHYYKVKTALQDGKDISAENQAFWDEQPTFHGDNQYADVNHSFWVPEARLKIDAVAGLRSYVQWQPDRVTGPDDHFQVVCAELCGAGHNGMRTDMCVVSQDTFDWWLGLATDERGDANCVNLRLLSCLGDDPGDRGKAIEKIAALSKEDPEAGCGDVKEQAA